MEYFVPMLFVILGIFLLTVAAKTIKIVPQATVMLIERLGRFSRVAESGLNVIVPFLDKPRSVYWTNMRPGLNSIDLREQYLDLPPRLHAPKARSRQLSHAQRARKSPQSFKRTALHRHAFVRPQQNPKPSGASRRLWKVTAILRSI